MDIRKIKKLIELLEESGLAEIEITEGEESVRIARMTQGTQVVHQVARPRRPLPRPPRPLPRQLRPRQPPPPLPPATRTW